MYNRYVPSMPKKKEKSKDILTQLVRDRFSEKVHATSPNGIVGGFEFIVLQRNLKE